MPRDLPERMTWINTISVKIKYLRGFAGCILTDISSIIFLTMLLSGRCHKNSPACLQCSTYEWVLKWWFINKKTIEEFIISQSQIFLFHQCAVWRELSKSELSHEEFWQTSANSVRRSDNFFFNCNCGNVCENISSHFKWYVIFLTQSFTQVKIDGSKRACNIDRPVTLTGS